MNTATPTMPLFRQIETWFLLLSASAFLCFGFAFLLFPASVCATIDIQLNSPTAITDIRATYGGFELGLGLALCYCAWRPPLHGVGLLLTALTVGGFGAGRLFGILVDGAEGQLMIGFFLLEAVVTVLALILLTRWKRRTASAP